jgi:hypothetical protein
MTRCAVDRLGRVGELVEPLLPVKERRFRYPGPEAAARSAGAAGILFV